MFLLSLCFSILSLYFFSGISSDLFKYIYIGIPVWAQETLVGCTNEVVGLGASHTTKWLTICLGQK